MDLKELLGEEQYNQLMEKLGDKHKIAIVNDGNWFPKVKFDEVNEAKKKLEIDLAERDTQLVTLKKSAGDNEALKTQITTLQTENKTAKETYEAELKELTLTSAIKTALVGKVHDADLAAGLFDREKLVVDGDKVVGLEDQLTTLKESKPFLFVSEEETKPGFNRVGSNGEPTPPGDKPVSLKDAIASHFNK